MMSKRPVVTLLAAIVIALGTLGAIFFAKGFQFDFSKKEIQKTGIITATSEPDGAKVYLDGKLVGATNTTFTLSPKIYEVKIAKEGYQVWQKKISVQEELVSKIEAMLFPIAPELKPLTFSGVKSPVLSPDGQKIAFIVKSPADKAGLWLLNLGQAPLNFGQANIKLVQNTDNLDFSQATVSFSPDSRNILVSFKNANYILETSRLNNNLADMSFTLDQTLKIWQEEILEKETARLSRLTQTEQKLATSGAVLEKRDPKTPNYIPFGITWSPDEEKYFYKNNQNQLIMVDTKEKKEAKISAPKEFFWYPDSAHLVLVEDNLISLVELDGANKTAVYSGFFENDFVFPWPGGGRLVILTSFNQISGTEPNLYSVNLK